MTIDLTKLYRAGFEKQIWELQKIEKIKKKKNEG